MQQESWQDVAKHLLLAASHLVLVLTGAHSYDDCCNAGAAEMHAGLQRGAYPIESCAFCSGTFICFQLVSTQGHPHDTQSTQHTEDQHRRQQHEQWPRTDIAPVGLQNSMSVGGRGATC